MERLTVRCNDGEVGVIKQHCSDNLSVRMAIDKLADYEDADEQGRVISLSLAEGDTLYRISDDYSYISKETVSGFAITKEFGTYILLGDFGRSIHAANLGRMIFRTREEAEAKLAEISKED